MTSSRGCDYSVCKLPRAFLLSSISSTSGLVDPLGFLRFTEGGTVWA
jgi:hypothetical protein